ncbi:hypothetical protein MY11210_009288 [Beauveria gryllotalpidicola]
MAELLSRKFGIDEDLAQDIITVRNLVSARSIEERQTILEQDMDMDLKRAFDFLTAKEKIRPRTTDYYHFHLWRADWFDDAEYLAYLLRWALSTGETRRHLFRTSDVDWKKRFLFALYAEGSKLGTRRHHTGLLLEFIESLQDRKGAALRLLTKSVCDEIIGDLPTSKIETDEHTKHKGTGSHPCEVKGIYAGFIEATNELEK